MVFSDRDKLLNICHALGGRARCDDPTLGSAQTPYIPGDEVLECLKDLRKILKLDLATTDKPSFKTLGEWDVLRLDLLPILCVSDSVKVKIAVVELLVPMTWPINENSPDVPAEVELLTRYKEAFLENNAFAVIGKLLLSFVAIPLRNRTERDSAKIRIILLLFRNLLAMRDPLATSTASTEDFLRMNLSEHIIAKMHAAGILDVLLTFAASLDQREFNDWNMIILEIFHLLFRDRDPASISADQNNEANVKEKLATFDSQIRKPTSTRHSRFGGALKVHLPDGTKVNVFGTKNIINFGVGRALDSSKMGRNLVREQKPEVDPGIRRLQSKEARQVLHRLAVSFTKEGFNTFVRSVKRDFDIERGTVQEVNYFQFIQTVSFVLRFFQSVRSDEINLDRVISFMDQRGLLFLLKRLRIYQEEKKWTEVQVTLDCLKNFSSDEEIRDLGENVLRNIFYEEWIVESLVALCRTYKSQSIRYLEVLVETTHILLKTLQSYSKEKSFVVGRKKRQAKKAKKVQTQTPDEEPGLREDDSSDENEKPVETTVEREFRFEKIEMDFAYESVVRTYCDLLSRFETIEPKYVHYITVMLHRICVKSKMESLCYKVSTLDLFARILDSTHFLRTPEGKELQAFANHIVRRLSGALESYPMLLIDALFPKTRSDCVRIQNFSWDETEETKKEPLAISDLGEIEVKPRCILWPNCFKIC
ncbi:timeless protein-domain-containing protein [Zopfochytrium polystomum]|nr:timeless protein-domain-containing protein [Zopfochytrium polystomum]